MHSDPELEVARLAWYWKTAAELMREGGLLWLTFGLLDGMRERVGDHRNVDPYYWYAVLAVGIVVIVLGMVLDPKGGSESLQ